MTVALSLLLVALLLVVGVPFWVCLGIGTVVMLATTGVLGRIYEDHAAIEPEDVFRAAKEAEVCPFEVSLELSGRVQVTVCDYNYAFDPYVSLTDFAASEDANKLYAKSYSVTAYPNISGKIENYPENEEQLMIKNDFSWAAANRDRILEEWTKRYDTKSAPKS